ncbi:hypothetical protein [Cupriavidus necator]|uniref:hypothetical protein n=1 Tax=Cupriavidus necator TaxID=106590 RepID=UPI001F2ED2FC|nr:hypothetical protein [Cupriavidus necator]
MESAIEKQVQVAPKPRWPTGRLPRRPQPRISPPCALKRATRRTQLRPRATRPQPNAKPPGRHVGCPAQLEAVRAQLGVIVLPAQIDTVEGKMFRYINDLRKSRSAIFPMP